MLRFYSAILVLQYGTSLLCVLREELEGVTSRKRRTECRHANLMLASFLVTDFGFHRFLLTGAEEENLRELKQFSTRTSLHQQSPFYT